MYLVDVHAHLDHPKFDEDLDTVIKRAKANGIVTVITAGLNYESNERCLALASDVIKVGCGLYPTECDNVTPVEGYERETAYSVESTLKQIEEHADKITAISEVGIDFKESEDKEIQIENFKKVVALAKKLRKPLIIHSRKAEKEVLDVLEEMKYFRAVMHCFMGSKKLLKRGVELGLYFSIPTAVVRNEQFQQNAEIVPIGQMLTETDAPYMGPMKDLRNEPANIREAVLKLADIKRLEPEELANAIYFNYQKLFQ